MRRGLLIMALVIASSANDDAASATAAAAAEFEGQSVVHADAAGDVDAANVAGFPVPRPATVGSVLIRFCTS